MQCQAKGIGELLRRAREQQGLSQRRLALRAGTSQDAISRIERGVEAPTLERFAQVMLVLGRQAVIQAEPLPARVPSAELVRGRESTPGERLREGASWNSAASKLAAAGEQARRERHPATRGLPDE